MAVGKTEYENTKEYLSQIQRMDKVIQNKISEIAQLKALSISISGLRSEEKVQTSPNYDKIGTAFAKIEEMEDELNKMIDDCSSLKKTIIDQISSIEDDNYYQLLFSRYVERKTFEVISTEMQYTFRHITRLHGKALKQFEKKFGKLYLKNKKMS